MDINEKLELACEEGDLEQAKKTIEEGADPSFDFHVPLIRACENNHVNVIKYLLSILEVDEDDMFEIVISCSVNKSYDAFRALYSNDNFKAHIDSKLTSSYEEFKDQLPKNEVVIKEEVNEEIIKEEQTRNGIYIIGEDINSDDLIINLNDKLRGKKIRFSPCNFNTDGNVKLYTSRSDVYNIEQPIFKIWNNENEFALCIAHNKIVRLRNGDVIEVCDKVIKIFKINPASKYIPNSIEYCGYEIEIYGSIKQKNRSYKAVSIDLSTLYYINSYIKNMLSNKELSISSGIVKPNLQFIGNPISSITVGNVNTITEMYKDGFLITISPYDEVISTFANSRLQFYNNKIVIPKALLVLDTMNTKIISMARKNADKLHTIIQILG